MLLSETQLKKIIRRILSEAPDDDDTPPVWGQAKSMSPSQDCYDTIFEKEGPVPYVYGDAKKMSEKLAIKLYGEDLIKSKKMQDIVKNSWPVGKIPYPVDSFNTKYGFPTIGAGHLIKTSEEFEKFKMYTLGEIVPRDKENPKKPDEEYLKFFKAGNSRTTIEDLMMPDEEIKELFRSDVDAHTKFKDRITQPITQEMFDALTSFAFNAGWEEKHPTKGYKMPIQYIIELINKKEYKKAQAKILTLALTSGGEKMPGLASRRKDESEKFGEGGLSPA